MTTQETIRQILKDIDASLSTKDDAFLDRWISYSLSEVRAEIFGGEDKIDYQKCVAYLTASKIQGSILGSTTSNNYSTGAGGLKSKKAGNVELQYYQANTSSSSSSTVDSKGNSDIYMTEYKRILKKYTANSIILEHSL